MPASKPSLPTPLQVNRPVGAHAGAICCQPCGGLINLCISRPKQGQTVHRSARAYTHKHTTKKLCTATRGAQNCTCTHTCILSTPDSLKHAANNETLHCSKHTPQCQQANSCVLCWHGFVCSSLSSCLTCTFTHTHTDTQCHVLSVNVYRCPSACVLAQRNKAQHSTAQRHVRPLAVLRQQQAARRHARPNSKRQLFPAAAGQLGREQFSCRGPVPVLCVIP